AGVPPTVASWSATFWSAGGSAAVVLRDPNDGALKARVESLLKKMAADPQYGIARIVGQSQLSKMGGFPSAAFLVDLKDGYEATWSLAGPLVVPAPSTGEHGYMPDRLEMRSSFFVMGKGIGRPKNLGIVDMRQIAPTIAELLGFKFSSRESAPLK